MKLVKHRINVLIGTLIENKINFLKNDFNFLINSVIIKYISSFLSSNSMKMGRAALEWFVSFFK